MSANGLTIHNLPALKDPMLIAGFGGWGNALNLSIRMVRYLIRRYAATPFGEIDVDAFYRFDETRPRVRVDNGILRGIAGYEGIYYAAAVAAGPHDLVLFKAEEPTLKWHQFVREMLDLCDTLQVGRIITLGSMYDNVTHDERMVTAIASNPELLARMGIDGISYQGPTAIHGLVQQAAEERRMEAVSLWAHCPYYMEDTPHFGLMARMGDILSALAELHLDNFELEQKWGVLRQRIDQAVTQNEKLQELVEKIRTNRDETRHRVRGRKGDRRNIIDLKDFLTPTE